MADNKGKPLRCNSLIIKTKTINNFYPDQGKIKTFLCGFDSLNFKWKQRLICSLLLLAFSFPISLYSQTSIDCPLPVTDCEISHTTTVEVDNIEGCLTDEIKGNIEQKQSDCRDEQNTNGSCHKFVFTRDPSTSNVTGLAFDFGQGDGCNGDVDAGYTVINGECTDLGTGGSQSSTSFMPFPMSESEITLIICKSSSSFYSLCGFCACELTLSCNPSPACDDKNNGSVSTTVSGNSGTVTYTITPAADPSAAYSNTSGNFDGLAAGTYTITAADENGCQGSCTVEVENENCCPDLSGITPGLPSVNNSTCSDFGGTPSGGELTAPQQSNCPSGSKLLYSTDGENFSENLPEYNQTTPITITTICACDSDNSIVSNTASVTTDSGDCPTIGGPADCSNITVTGGIGQITVSGLTAANEIVEVIGAGTGWQVITICNFDCSDPTIISNLPPGFYDVKVQMFGNESRNQSY